MLPEEKLPERKRFAQISERTGLAEKFETNKLNERVVPQTPGRAEKIETRSACWTSPRH